ncbi:MAG: hypothetical protein GY866_15860 [Proteobacteria bacterium]|nr:hypothetical protein [Pseudomonadota bacterium]
MKKTLITIIFVVSIACSGSILGGCSGSGSGGKRSSKQLSSKQTNRCKTTRPSARGALHVVRCGFR